MATLPKNENLSKGGSGDGEKLKLAVVVDRFDRRLGSYKLVWFVRTGALYTSIELTF